MGSRAAALIDLSTVAGNKISNPPWVKFQSAGWVNFPSAPTIWTNEAIAMLGQMPDMEVADRLDISNFPVKKKRHELGIKAYKRPLPEITPEIASAFGVVSDAELARQLGVSVSYIRKARTEASQQ